MREEGRDMLLGLAGQQGALREMSSKDSRRFVRSSRLQEANPGNPHAHRFRFLLGHLEGVKTDVVHAVLGAMLCEQSSKLA